jgi:hypothetical protein
MHGERRVAELPEQDGWRNKIISLTKGKHCWQHKLVQKGESLEYQKNLSRTDSVCLRSVNFIFLHGIWQIRA